jgi:hypothetical protein
MVSSTLMVLVVVAFAAAVVSGEGARPTKLVPDHGDLLDQLKPNIIKVSAEIVAAAKGGDDLEEVLTSVITKDLLQQMKKLSVIVSTKPDNESVTYDCCACASCQRYYLACCGCATCSTGTNCYCSNCRFNKGAGGMRFVEKLGADVEPEIKSWVQSSKAMLQGDLTRSVIANTKVNDNCCTCSQCRKTSNGCSGKYCCLDGDDCLCESCSDNSQNIIAASIWNPMSLAPAVQQAIEKVSGLVDFVSMVIS